MALEPKLKETGINKAGTEYYIADNTGAYDAVANPGGYGSPNKERTEVALFLLATFKSTKEDIPLTLLEYDPAAVSSFTLPLDRDGWIQFQLFQIDKYNQAVAYLAGAVTYDAEIGSLQKFDGESWSLIKDRDLLSETGLVSVTFDRFFSIQATKYLNKLTKMINELPPCRQKEEMMFLYDEIYHIILGSNADFCDGNKYPAQETMELLAAHRIKL